VHICTNHLISIFATMSICNPWMQCFAHDETLQVQASASKLRQLLSTTVFEDFQLLVRSADAPGLPPEHGYFTCLLFHLNCKRFTACKRENIYGKWTKLMEKCGFQSLSIKDYGWYDGYGAFAESFAANWSSFSNSTTRAEAADSCSTNSLNSN